MTKKEFEEYISFVEKQRNLQKIISETSIEWETDISKIDLSVLFSRPKYASVIKDPVKIEWLNPSDLIPHSKEPLLIFGDQRMEDLICIVRSGKKIIPPLISKNYMLINGEFKNRYIDREYDFNDGAHRIKLANHLGLKQIPVLVQSVISRAVFNTSEWNLSCNEINIIISHNKENKTYEFPLNNSNVLRYGIYGDEDYFDDSVCGIEMW